MDWMVSPGMLVVIIAVLNSPKGWWRPVVLIVLTVAVISFYSAIGENLTAFLWGVSLLFPVAWLVGIFINHGIPYNRQR